MSNVSSPFRTPFTTPTIAGTSASGPQSTSPAPSGAEPPPAYPPPAPGVDVGEAIAKLVIDNAFSRRTTAREARGHAEIAAGEMQKEEIAQMQVAADERWAAAKADAIGQMAAGGLEMLGGTFALGVGGDQGRAYQGLFQGGADATKGVGSLLAAGGRHDADLADAAAKAAGHAAETMTHIADDWNDDAKAARETIEKAMDFLKEYQAAHAQSQSAALHRA